jgi:hypothetical protein
VTSKGDSVLPLLMLKLLLVDANNLISSERITVTTNF